MEIYWRYIRELRSRDIRVYQGIKEKNYNKALVLCTLLLDCLFEKDDLMRYFVFYTCGKQEVRNILPAAKLNELLELLRRPYRNNI